MKETPMEAPEFVERVARAWASMDGKADRFDACKADPLLDATEGHYQGYIADAEELLHRADLAPSGWQDIATATQVLLVADGLEMWANVLRKGGHIEPTASGLMDMARALRAAASAPAERGK